MRVFTLGHGARHAAELLACLHAAGVATLVDVRRFPSSRRHPQFDREALAETLAGGGIAYRHAVELGGRRSGEPGEVRFACIRTPAFRSYAARIGTREWQATLAGALAEEAPCCFLCAETLWWRCHRRFIADVLLARGHDVVHLIRPHETRPHRLLEDADVRDGKLYLCGALVG